MGQNTLNDSRKKERPTQIAHHTMPSAQPMAPSQMAPRTTGESMKLNTGLLNVIHASSSANHPMYGSLDHTRKVDAWVNGTSSNCQQRAQQRR